MRSSAALALLEDVGEAFSVRKLAQSVGCDPMSVLYHFKSKEGLSRAIANALSRSLVPVDPSPCANGCATWRASTARSRCATRLRSRCCSGT